MHVSVKPASYDQIAACRDLYRHEMNCQIIHDSIHLRPGWTLEYAFQFEGALAGYGSVAVGGPWKANPTIYEFYVLPHCRSRLFEFFSALVASSGSTSLETQSNDVFLTVPLLAYARNISSESILFQDSERTVLLPPGGAVFRRATEDDLPSMLELDLDVQAKWIIELEGRVAAAGDILFHYNRPFGDIYMKVSAAFRQRGLGSYLVQELKRVCFEGGNAPAARCNPSNFASRKTLQKAGFVPCGTILTGTVQSVVLS